MAARSAGAVTTARLHEGEAQADEALVRQLLADQHPAWADLAVRRVPSTGTDHAVFRLGDDMVVRLPRIRWAERQVAGETAWLPLLTPHLPAGVPVPIAAGAPGRGYPFRWLVSPWVPGRDVLEVLAEGEAFDWPQLASDLARFLRSLQAIATDGAPASGKRGQALAARDELTRAGIAALDALDGEVDGTRAREVWDAALAADPWPGPPVWIHGDLLPGNLVVARGRLAGVIDWSSTGVGDPACELMVAWSLPADARARLRAELEVDDATWARARGWVVEQAVPFIPYYERTLPTAVAVTRQRLAAVLAEPSP